MLFFFENIIKARLLFLALTIVATFLFSFSPAHAAGKQIGETCNVNAECASGDCEDSTFEGPNGDDYCDCDDNNDCAAQYGPGNWTCVSGTAQSYTLDFCKNGTTTHYPVGSNLAPNQLKNIGEICAFDSECKSNDCEKSTVKNSSGDYISYCDCDDDNDCSVQYGKNSWSCVDGNQKSNDLDFCSAYGKTEYPVSPDDATESPGIYNTLFHPETAVDQRELENLIQAPQPRIKIPGVQFTDIERVKKNIKEEDGPAGHGTYLSIPFVGEYLAALYRFAVITASLIAVVIIIIQGFVITTSAGSADRISSAKERIGQALTGLIIAAASYIILFTINPELVQFRNLKVLVVEREEIPNYPITLTDDDENQSVSTGPYTFQYFTSCPVSLSNPIEFKDDKKKKPGDIRKNVPRRVEFHEKMIAQNILKGNISQRLVMAVEAAAQCKIHYENCGVGTTNMYALAAKRGEYGDTCLKNTNTGKSAKTNGSGGFCNILGGSRGNIHKKTVNSVYSSETKYGKKVSTLLKGLYCGSVPQCGKSVGWTEPCFADSTAASQKLKEILLSTGKWSPDWVDQLQPGDYYMIVNWNPSCQATHSAMFLGWKDKANRVAWVQMGDAGNFIRIGTKKFNDKDLVIQITRPIE